MTDNFDSDSDVEFPPSRKRKLGALSFPEKEDEESDEDDDDNDDDDGDDDDGDGDGEDMDSDGEDEEDESDGEESGDDDDDAVNDVDLSDDVNSDQCSICLIEFTHGQLLGVPDSCEHVFCSVCIHEWAKHINTCPVDRKVFHVIRTRQTIDGPQIDQIKVEDRTNIEEEYEDPTSCEVCGIGDREESMLLCDGCDRGFHLECLTPPLESVPDGEWFCSDCFSSNSPLEPHDSQEEIEEEMPSVPPGQQRVSDGRIPRARPSTSRRRRARTVATTRRRRRTRGQTGTRGTRRRAQAGRSSSRPGSSSRGASTSTTRGKRKSTKKRRRRKGKRKRRKGKGKSTSESQNKRRREDSPPASRYMLPHEMEASASFSIFGNDFNLACLPCVEPPAPIAAAKTEVQRSFATSNPDVLGSIFSGLTTLHRKDLSVDAKGRVKVCKELENNTSSESPADVPSTSFKQGHSPDAKNGNTSYKERKPSSSPSSGNEVSNKKDEQSIKEQPGKAVVKRINRDSRDIGKKKDNTCGASDRSSEIPDINEKRIKRFDVIAPVKQCSVSTKTASKGGEGRSTPEPMTKSKTTDRSQSSDVAKYSKYDKMSCTTKTAEPKTTSNSTYRIPRKKSILTSVLVEASKESKPSVEVKRESKCKEVNVKTERSLRYKDVVFSQPSKSVMDLLSRASSQQRTAELRTEERKNMPSTKTTCHDSTSVSSYDILDTTPGISSVDTSFQSCVPDAEVQKTTSGILGVHQKTPSPLVVDQSEKTNLSSAKSGDSITQAKNPASKTYNSSADFCKINQERPKPSGYPSSSRQTATNHDIIDMIKRKKSVLSDNDSDNTDGPSSKSALKVSTKHEKGFSKATATRNSGSVRGKAQLKVLPPLRPVQIPRRPVAVVRPTTTSQGACFVAREGSNEDDDASRRRIEGIERLQRHQKISDEVRKALKSFYRHEEITREQYKEIYKRATEKIEQSSLPVEPRGVSTLVRNYVKRVKGNQMNLNAAT